MTSQYTCRNDVTRLGLDLQRLLCHLIHLDVLPLGLNFRMFTVNKLGVRKFRNLEKQSDQHGVQRRMISVDNFFVFLRLLFFALLSLYVT